MSFNWQEYLNRYDFDLPEELIASRPPRKRDESRLLLLHRESGDIRDLVFSDLPSLLASDDLMLFNTTRVSRRRVALQRMTGGRISSLFLGSGDDGYWSCLIKGSGKLKSGEILETIQSPKYQFRYHGKPENNPQPNEIARYLEPIPAWGSLDEAEQFFEQYGQPPLPPYMKREAEPGDLERYQTVYADRPGSVAGPTAGFHFTEALMNQCRDKGVKKVEVDLQIGYGTFAPLEEKNFLDKKLHTETYTIEQAELLNSLNQSKRIAVGTTTLRALEDNYRRNQGHFSAGPHQTSIFIYPPEEIRSINGLITNFHLPRSSLFLLVCAFGGREKLIKAYEHAIKEKYRFYSYGDAMIIL